MDKDFAPRPFEDPDMETAFRKWWGKDTDTTKAHGDPWQEDMARQGFEQGWQAKNG